MLAGENPALWVSIRGAQAPQPVKVGAASWRVRHGSKPESKEVRFFPSPLVCLLYLL